MTSPQGSILGGLALAQMSLIHIFIPSFLALGVKKEDAYNYSAIGCVEVAIIRVLGKLTKLMPVQR